VGADAVALPKKIVERMMRDMVVFIVGG
jgi:hypothetical protein